MGKVPKIVKTRADTSRKERGSAHSRFKSVLLCATPFELAFNLH